MPSKRTNDEWPSPPRVETVLRAGVHCIRFPRRPLVMGIVNVNDDSFCRDGTLDPDAALRQAGAMLRQGADIIDVGAESARTNRPPIPVQEEIVRLLPFLERFAKLVDGFGAGAGDASGRGPFDREQLWPPLLSVNTWRPEVVAAVLPFGGDLVNDMGALPDDRNARLCAEHGRALLVMHSVGPPKVPQIDRRYADLWGSLEAFFESALARATRAGLSEEAIILDPGIDFAKQRDDNLRILREVDRLHRFGRPLLLPVSRKTVVGEVLGIPDPLDRDAGTIACLVAGALRGVQIFRVHHVEAATRATKVLHALLAAAA